MTHPGGLPGDPAGQQRASPPPVTRTNRTAIASLTSSVITLFGLGSIVGIGLGVYALNQIAVSGDGGRGLAIAGILVGAITLLLSMIGIVMGLDTL